MIRVKSASYDPVEIPELKDTIFYEQEKSYSESQYASAPTLRNEIRQGRLTVLERTGDNNAQFKAPEPSKVKSPDPTEAPPQRAPVNVADDKKYESLLGEIKNLTEAVTLLKNKNEELEQRSPEPQTSTDPQVMQMLKGMAEKMGELSKQVEDTKKSAPVSTGTAQLDLALKDISKKISGLAVSGEGVRQVDNNRDPNSVYVPDIQVQDMSNNIKLEPKNLGQGGTVNDALSKLREIQNKNKSN